MAKISLEDMLDALNQLRGQPLTPEAIAALRKALASTSNHVVTKASQVVNYRSTPCTRSSPTHLIGS